MNASSTRAWRAFWALASVIASVSSATVLAQGGPGVWGRAVPMPGTRSETATAVVDSRIYVIGGNTIETVGGKPEERYDAGLNQVYDPKADAWRTLAPMPDGAGHVAIAVIGRTIYVAGGFKVRQHKGPVANVYAYHPDSDRWETLAPLPRPRGSPSMVAVDGKLHIFGGRLGDPTGPIADHDVYDPKTGKWTAARPMPTARDHMGIGVFDGRIYVVGGRTGGSDANVGTVEIYDPKTDAWSSAPAMPTPRSGGAFAVYRGKLFFLGGECRNKATYNENEAFDFAAGTWSALAPLPVGRHAFSAATVGATLYVIGGSTGCGGKGMRADNLTFRLP